MLCVRSCGTTRGPLLIEDDHGHGIVDLPLHPLAGVTRHWAFVRSAAKAYGPDLRLAVLTGDAVTVDRVRGRLSLGPRLGEPPPATGRGPTSGRGARWTGRRWRGRTGTAGPVWSTRWRSGVSTPTAAAA